MAMTMTQNILAKHAGKKEVHPGQLIQARVDLALANDIESQRSADVLNAAIEEILK